MVPLSLRDFRETNKELLKVQAKQMKDWLSFQKKQDKACLRLLHSPLLSSSLSLIFNIYTFPFLHVTILYVYCTMILELTQTHSCHE